MGHVFFDDDSALRSEVMLQLEQNCNELDISQILSYKLDPDDVVFIPSREFEVLDCAFEHLTIWMTD